MKLQVIKIINYDEQCEINRINRLFTGDTRERLLNVVSLFVTGDYDACKVAINELPYNQEDHCREQEFVCDFISNFLWELTVDKTITEIKDIT